MTQDTRYRTARPLTPRCAPDSPDHEYLPPDGSWEGVDEPGEE